MTITAAPGQARNGSADFQGATILMVCAQSERREALARVLTEDGNRVLFPPSRDEAVARLSSGDLLVLYVEAPGESEFELLCSLRDSESSWQVPVIIVSGKDDAASLESCVRLGAEDALAWPVNAGRLQARVRACVLHKQRWQQERLNFELTAKGKQEAELLVSSLIPLGISMVKEKDSLRLMELILTEGMRITDCEGGTIYMRGLENTLNFLLVRNDMLDINMGGSTGKPITFPPLKLYNDEGKPNQQYVANHAAISGQTINIEDAYSAGRFDFSGTRKFDANTGYRSKSFLTVPLKNERQQVIGVMQLINARDPKTGAIVRFDAAIQPTIEAFALLAAAILDAYRTSQLGSGKV